MYSFGGSRGQSHFEDVPGRDLPIAHDHHFTPRERKFRGGRQVLPFRDAACRVEDRVHQVLADRLEPFIVLSGEIPDTLEEVWIEVALQNEQAANQLIDRTRATRNPFDVKYSKVDQADRDTCATVLDPISVNEQLSKGWT